VYRHVRNMTDGCCQGLHPFLKFVYLCVYVHVYACMFLYIYIAYVYTHSIVLYRGSGSDFFYPFKGSISLAAQGGDHVILRKVKEPVCPLDQSHNGQKMWLHF